MKLVTLVLLILCLVTASLGQRSPVSVNRAEINAAANKAWPSFYKRFRTAVRRRDRVALRQMLSNDLRYSYGHHRADNLDEAFKYWDQNDGWRGFHRILNQRTVPLARWWNNGKPPSRPSRVAPAAANARTNIDKQEIEWYAIFEFHSDGKWYCEMFLPCCD